MTKQEIFDKVATHLLKQGRKSESGGTCLYRGSDGLQCAAGCLLPDSVYKPEMEDVCIDDLFMRAGVARACGVHSVSARDLVQSLQSVHDDASVANWPAKLREVADAFNLSPAVLG